MIYRILHSKIEIPEIQKNLVIRERLLKFIDNCKEKMLVLYGTPGYGKTVLLSHYIRLYEVPCAWYHLDEMDNDWFTFFEYLTEAFSRIWHDFRFDVSAYLTVQNESSMHDQIGMDFILKLNEYLDLPQDDGCRAALVLDDFQIIRNEDIFTFIHSLMNYTSDNLKIYIATRGSLPDFTAALVLQEKVCILEPPVLAFTEGEVAQVLEKIAHFSIDGQISKNVFKKTEGWPVGTMFVAQYLKQNGYVQSNLDWDAISDESLIKNYIMSELYRKLPYDIQQFLVRTSVLDELSVNLCNSVLHINNARSTLNYLMQESLFITQVNKGTGNYRYHALFQLFLQRYVLPEQKKEILDRAAEYYVKQGIMDRALECCIRCDDPLYVEQYLVKYGEVLVQKKQFLTLKRCIDYLEADNINVSLSPEADRLKDYAKTIMESHKNDEEKKKEINVKCFGTFTVYLGEERREMNWRTKKAAELFAYLYECQGKTVKRNDLLKILWPDEYPNNAVAMLHNMLYNIRKELTPFGIQGLIEYANREYIMDTALISSDFDKIRQVCHAVERKNIDMLAENKALFFTYWGTYMEGIENTWCSRKKYYFEKCFLDGCNLLGVYLMQNGVWEDAAKVLRAGIEIDAYSENLAINLMRCYAGSNDKKMGKRLYERMCSVYRSELDIEPSKDFVRAYEECMNGLPELSV